MSSPQHQIALDNAVSNGMWRRVSPEVSQGDVMLTGQVFPTGRRRSAAASEIHESR